VEKRCCPNLLIIFLYAFWGHNLSSQFDASADMSLVMSKDKFEQMAVLSRF